MSANFLGVRACLLLLALVSIGSANGQVGVRLSEVMANNRTVRNSDQTITDWVELQNTTGAAVDLAGASLTDDPSSPRKWVFPAGSSIPANGYLVILMDAARGASTTAEAPMNAGFGLSASGETVYFLGRGTPPPLIDSIAFGIQAVDYTVGRVGASWTLNVPTPGADNTAAMLGAVTSLFINEWMASPSSGDDWFEILNSGDHPVALGGLYLTDTTTLKRNSLIPAHSYIGTGLNGFTEFFADGNTDNGADHVNFSLRAAGEAIGLYTASEQQLDLVTFGAQEEGVSQGRLPDGTGTIVKFPNAATPGSPNFVIFPGIVVSEVMSHSDPPYEDAVEFQNVTGAPINIGGWYLSDSNSRLKKWRVPDNTTIPAGGYVAFYEYQFNGATAAEPFSFSSSKGDEVYLSEANAAGVLSGRVVREEFEAAANNVSFGRVTTTLSAGDYKFVALDQPTFGVSNPASVEAFRGGTGAANAPYRIHPVTITEIMYHPPTNGVGDNLLDEYIEIYNMSEVTVPLYDTRFPTNTWRVRDAVGYTFPSGAVLEPYSYALIVSFNPTNQTQLNTFRARYGVPPTVQIFGPYLDKLGNDQDPLEIYRPDTPQLPGTPDEGFVPYLRVDKVNYTVNGPWPTGAKATGNSIQKRMSHLFGNEPSAWVASAPTAGRANAGENTDTDADGMPDSWEAYNKLNPASAGDATGDPDRDGLTNLQEFQAKTNPRVPNVAAELKITGVSKAPGGPISVTIASESGKSYSLVYRDTITATTWQTAASGTATGTSLTLQDSGGGAMRFYKVVTPQQ